MLTGLSLQYLLHVPTRRPDTERLPMVVMIHGRGADAYDLADLSPMLDTPEGCRFVLPNAPKPFSPAPGMTFGWTWFEGWPPTHDSVVESRQTLLRFIDEVTERYPTSHLVLAGFSQGGMMSLDAGLRTERDLAGIVVMSGGLYDRDLPDLTRRRTTPVLIAHGQEDEVVPIAYARRARLLLEQQGLPVEYHEYPMGHQVIPEEIDLVREFIARA